MMTKQNCHLDWIWSLLKLEWLDTPVRHFLNHITWSGETQPEHRWYFCWQPRKGSCMRETDFFVVVLLCFHHLWQVHLSCGCGIPQHILKPSSLGFHCWLRICSSIGTLKALNTILGQVRYPALCTEQPSEPQPLQCETVTAGHCRLDHVRS